MTGPPPPEGGRFVYHIVPANLVGQDLHPLNRLSEIHPRLAEEHSAKYAGREWLRRMPVTPLGCTWSDVLMFSPVHPSHVTGAIRHAGLQIRPLRWFALPAERLAPESTVIVLPGPSERQQDPTAMRYHPYSAAALAAFSAVPDVHRRYLAGLRPGDRPLLFAQIAHVVHRGSVDVGSLEVLQT